MSRAAAHFFPRASRTRAAAHAPCARRRAPRTRAASPRSLLTISSLLGLLLLLGTTPPAARANTVLGVTGCRSADSLLVLPPTGGGTARSGADCTIGFGSSDGTAMLHMTQTDGGGTTMSRPSTGVLDTAFAGDGHVEDDVSASDDEYRSVAVQPDGKVVVLGMDGALTDMVVRRYLPDGTLDPSFATGGVRTFPGTNSARDLALAPDGSIFVLGHGAGQVNVAKLTPSGAFDPTFNGGTWTTRTFSSSGGTTTTAESIALGRGGEVYAAGYTDTTGTAGNYDVIVYNLTADGRFDPTFDGDGVRTIDLGGVDRATSVVEQADGRIAVTGTSNVGGTTDMAVVRLNPDGTLDTTFTGDGSQVYAIGAATDDGNAIVQRPTGELVVAGEYAVGAYWDSLLLQLTPSGAVDTSFSDDGIATIAGGTTSEFVNDAALQPDGSVVLAGSQTSGAVQDILLQRILPSGTPDTGFGSGGQVVYDAGATTETLRGVATGVDGRIAAAGYPTTAGNDATDLLVFGVQQISDYATGSADFTPGGNLFGACLRAVGGSGTTDASTWSANPTCPLTTGAWWHGVPTAMGAASKVATTTASGAVDATASLRFGLEVAGSEPAGAYRAPVTIDVIAPNLDPPVNTVAPTISGTAQVRQLLTATTGTWTGSAPINYVHQWQRCTPTCADIAGATGTTYRVTQTDLGATLLVRVTATNTIDTASASSAQTAAVIAGPTPSLFYVSGFEHGTTSTLGGGIVDGTFGSGTLASDTAVVRNGTRSMRFTSSGNGKEWDVNLPAGVQRSATSRLYFNVATMPTGTRTIAEFETAGLRYCEIRLQTSGLIEATMTGAGTQAGPTLQTNRWYRLDYSCDMSTTTHRIRWAIDGVAQTDLTYAGQPLDDMELHQLGIDGSTTMDIRFDDVALSTTGADYPLGPGKVLGYAPNATGAHATHASFGTTVNDGGAWTTLTAADDNQTPGTAALLDDWPVNTTGTADAVRQTALTGSLDYRFADTAETGTIEAVSVIHAARDVGAGSSDASVALDAGAGLSPATSVDASGTMTYSRSTRTTVPVSGAPWTAATFNALRAVITSTNVTGAVPQTDALLAEVSFVGEAAPVNVALPTISGDLFVGATLTATTGSWTPLTGLTYTYQWQRCTPTCANVAGATGSTYALAAGDQGNTLRVLVTAGNGGGNQVATSAQTTSVGAQLPTLTQLDGFESGQVLSTGTAYSSVMTTGGTVAADTTWARSGRYSLRVVNAGSAANTGVQYGGGTGTAGVVRVAVRLESLPLAFTELAEVTTADGLNCELRYSSSNGRLTAAVQGGAAQNGPLVEAGRWYAVDLRCDVSTGTRRVDWYVDGTAYAQATRAVAASTISGLSLGNTSAGSSSGYTASYDDLAVSATSADFPIGYGTVEPLAPTQVGTHGTIANFERSSNGGGSWGALTAENDALPGTASLLADAPTTFTAGSVGTLLRQVTAGSYLEYQLADSDLTAAPSAIKGLAVHSAETATAQNAQLIAELSGATTTLYTADPVGANTLNANQGIMATRPGGGAWTAANVDALRLRISSSNVGTAANERPRTHDILAEAAFPSSAPPSSTAVPQVQQPWSSVKVGDVLEVDAGTWSSSVLDRAWQWVRCSSTGVACIPISGATGRTYTLQAGDAGSTIRVDEQARGTGGWQTARSLATQLVATQPTFATLSGFEAGPVTATPSNDGLWFYNAVTYSGAQVHSGAAAISAPAAATERRVAYTPSAGTRVTVQRSYVYVTALPGPVASLVNVSLSSGDSCDVDLQSSGLMSIEWNGGIGHIDGPTLALNRWYLVEMRADTTSTTWRCDWSVDGTSIGTSVRAGAPAAYDQTELSVGHIGGSAMALYVDDWAISTTATDYPIGAGRTDVLVPNEAGVHTQTGFFGTDAGGLGASPWLRIDDPPAWGTTDYVSQTAMSATERLEWEMSDPPQRGRGARAVHSVVGFHASSTAANDGRTKVVRPGDTDAAAHTAQSGNMGFATQRWAGSIVPPPTAGWTIQALDALKMRTGYSTDATPTPLWDALALEVEYRD